LIRSIRRIGLGGVFDQGNRSSTKSRILIIKRYLENSVSIQGKIIGENDFTSSLAQKNPLPQGHQVSVLDGDIPSKVQFSEEVATARRKMPMRARRNGNSIEADLEKTGEPSGNGRERAN
jgi:hypothetical protein